ncbi:MAG: recombinase RecA [Myxococcota bacterium]
MVTEKKRTKKEELYYSKIKDAISVVEKKCGKGALMVQGGGKIKGIRAISTGSVNLDKALGIGGIPRGRVVEIYGPESSGKTTLALSTIAQAQKQDLLCAFVDAEHALDLEYAGKLGVKEDKLLISQPDYGEQALEIADILIQKGGVDLLVIDSVAALVPKSEIEGEMTDQQVGLQARMMSKALRKLTAGCSRNQATIIFINQLRMKIGVFFGSPETTPGGKALKFFSSVRMDIRRIGKIKEGDEISGNKIRIKVAKNKVAPPFKRAEFDLVFNEGIDNISEWIELGLEKKILQKSGSWYSYGEESLGQGKKKVKEFFKKNPKIFAELKKDITQKKQS